MGGPRGGNLGYWKSLAHPEGLRIIFVRKTQEYDFLSCMQKARKSIKWSGNLPKVPPSSVALFLPSRLIACCIHRTAAAMR